MKKKYDLIVIGAGSAGLVAATSAKRAGLNVALIEKNKIGGECLHTGCVPSKTFINIAKHYNMVKKSIEFGLPNFRESDKFDFTKVMEHTNDIIKHIYKDENPEVFSKIGIDVYVDKKGAKFISNKQVEINNEILDADNFIICTGSSPRKIELMGNINVQLLDNESFWNIRKLPQNILFIGGGVIAAELGQALNTFGSNVTIVDHNDRILSVVDKETANVVVQKFKQDGINLITNAEVNFCEAGNDCSLVRFIRKDGQLYEKEFDAIFFSAGRVPNIDGMNLENAGVEYDLHGIKANEYFQTTTKNIFACGDVTSKYKFTHTASMQADICVNNILNGNSKTFNENIVPWAIFTDPEIAHTGLSEKEAQKKYNNIKVFRVDARIDRFITDGKTEGFLKVIFDSNNYPIGAEAVGANAGEWIQLITLAIKNKITLDSIADTIFIYPTFSEIVKKAFTRFQRTLISL